MRLAVEVPPCTRCADGGIVAASCSLASAWLPPQSTTAVVLEKVITTTIVNWLAKHRDATPALVGEALSGAYLMVEILEDIEKRKSATVSEI